MVLRVEVIPHMKHVLYRQSCIPGCIGATPLYRSISTGQWTCLKVLPSVAILAWFGIVPPLTSCCRKSPCVLGSWSKSVISTLYVTNRKVGKVTDNVPYLFPSVYTLILDPVFFLLHTPRLVHFEQTLFSSALLSSQKS